MCPVSSLVFLQSTMQTLENSLTHVVRDRSYILADVYIVMWSSVIRDTRDFSGIPTRKIAKCEV